MTQPEQQIINRVLFVDDEIHILNAIRRGLHNEPYVKLFATSAEEALSIMASEDIHVIVSDMRMPGMNGLELLKIVKDKYPLVIKLILSGYTQLPQVLATINQIDLFRFIAKPWDMEGEFIQAIRAAISQYNLIMSHQSLQESMEKKNALYIKLLEKNESQITRLKKDLMSLKSIQKSVFEHIISIEETGDKNDVIQYFIEMFDYYVETLPSEQADINEDRLKNEFEKRWKSHFKDKEIHIIFERSQEPVTINGNLQLAGTVLVMLVAYFFKTEENSIIVSTHYEETRGFVLYMRSKALLNVKDRRQTETLLFLLGKLLGELNAALKVVHQGDENGIELLIKSS